MIISHKHKFIFFRPIGKCATSSVEDALKHLHEEDQGFVQPNYRTHISPRYYFLFIGKKRALKLMSYLRFAVVRNPYEWLMSVHCSNIKTPQSEHDKFEEFSKEDKKTNEFYVPTKYTYDSSAGSFTCKRVLEAVSSISGPGHLYAHETQFCAQCIMGRQIVNKIIRYERLESDFKKLCDEHSIPAKPLKHMKPRENKAKWKHYSYYYSKEAMQLVEYLYHFDFLAFGYEMESDKNDKEEHTDIFTGRPLI